MQHLACIMDGNRRFAKKHGWKPWVGHKKGVEAVRTTIDFCMRNAIPYLSLYTFSLENFKRSEEEKSFLFELLVEQLKEHADEFVEKKIRIFFIGDRTLFPASVQAICADVEQRTAGGSDLRINMLFCYGGQQEIVVAAQRLALAVQQGIMQIEEITDKSFQANLWAGNFPVPDLIFRTGGVNRLSGFLLYQAAYAEFYFSDILWPEITSGHLQQALDVFNERVRNFGS
jgi:undecaprenyl diphosphate synthase